MSALKSLEHGIKAAVFNMSRPILKRKGSKFETIDGNKISKVLFLRPEKIGDMVISFPVFDGLKARYPHLKISILGSPRSYGIIKGDPRFDKIFLYHKDLSIFNEVRKLRSEKFDCVVDMICDDSVTALYLSQLSAPGKPRIGVGKIKYRNYYDFNYDHRMGNTGHIIDNTLKLLEAFGIDSDRVDRHAPPFVNEDSKEKAKSFLASISSDIGKPVFIGLNLSAGSPTRVWPEEKYQQLIKLILKTNRNCSLILFTVGEDRARGEAIAAVFNRSVYQVPPNLSLKEATAIISQLDMMITPDTSLVHIARSFRVPVIGLYTRFMKNFLLWRPYGQEEGAVVSNNDDNIFDISVESVFDDFKQMLKTRAEETR